MSGPLNGTRLSATEQRYCSVRGIDPEAFKAERDEYLKRQRLDPERYRRLADCQTLADFDAARRDEKGGA